MAIWLYSGTPGSGKSLHATAEIRANLRMGRPVIANYDLAPDIPNRELFRYVDNLSITPDYLERVAAEWWSDHRFAEERILLVLDECQLIFNSREGVQGGKMERSQRMAWIRFFSQHRKYGYKIVLVAQFDRMIDRQIRSLIEYELLHRRVSSVGTLGFLAALPFGGKLFATVETYYPLKMRTGGGFFTCRRSVTRMYDSYKSFDGKGAGAALPGGGSGVPTGRAAPAPAALTWQLSRPA